MAIEYKNWKLESEIGIGIAYWELDLYIGNQNLKDTPLLFILELDNFNVSFVILREAKLMT